MTTASALVTTAARTVSSRPASFIALYRSMVQRRSREQPLLGIALIIASTIFFSLTDVLTKSLSSALPAVEIAWMRYLVFTALVLPFILIRSGGAALHTRQLGLQLLRGFGMVGSALLFTAGLRFLPVAEASAINFVSPILITGLSVLILGEIVGWRRWTAALVGLCGVLIVVRPGTGAFDPAAFFPLAAALSWAGAAVVTRKMSGIDGPATTLAYSALVGLLVVSALVPFDFVMPDGRQALLGGAIGVLSTIGHLLIVLAFRHASASVLAPFSYVQLIWAGVLGFAIFGAVPDGWTLCGAAVIVGSGLYTAHRERARSALESVASRR